ncbi:MAG: retropepsin-like domain-containing protein [Bacteroidales bacterium]|jgi:hypothetical protein|nr:retropepsin-like domain-containing protein [Bacteroidales bacterium]
MKREVFLFFMLCFSISSYAQVQRNYAQELIDLLHTERYFEAREIKSKYAYFLPQKDRAFDLIYDIHMALAFNKPDSAIVYLEEFLSNRDYERIMGPIIGSYYGRLVLVYEECQRFEQSIDAVGKHLDYLERNPFSMDQKFIESEILIGQNKIVSLKEKLKNEPLWRIVRDSDVQNIELKDSEYIRFDALYNGKVVETFFDTGSSLFCVMDEATANDIGVRISPNQDTMRMINGKPERALEGIIDEVELKGVKLYNIPVLILNSVSPMSTGLSPNDQSNIAKELLKEKQVVMGIPMMKMIGRFEFDWKANTFRISQRQEPGEISLASNFMFLRNVPYLNLKINDIGFTGFFDSGSNQFLNLTYPYCNSKSDLIELDTQKQVYTRTGFTGTETHIERQKVKDPRVYFDGRKIGNDDLDNDVYVADFSWSHINCRDGEAGVKFIKNIGSKCILDFDAMTVTIED